MAGPGRSSPQRVNLGGDPHAAGGAEPNPIHELNGKHDLAFLTEDSAGKWPLQGNQVGRKQMTDLKLLMDYFDFLGSISAQKEITANVDKEFPGPGNKNSNNRELVSLTRESKEREHRILTKIKTKKWCGKEEIIKIARKYGKVEKLKIDIENTPNKCSILNMNKEKK